MPAACVVVVTVAVIIVGAFSIVIVISIPYWHVINSFISEAVGTSINIIAAIGIPWAVSFGYLVMVLAFVFHSMKQGVFKYHRGTYIVVPVILALAWAFFYVLLWLLAGLVLSVFVRILGNILVYLMMAASCAILAVLWLAARPVREAARALRSPRYMTWRRELPHVFVLLAVIALACSGVLLPVISRPSTVTDLSLPSKPLIIGHRGSSNYAPENTIVAGNACVFFGLAGWEVDVQVSFDGVFFLMHDDTLQRTTNIADIFPERSTVDAAWFNFSDLQQLDAGSWFADEDPYYTIISGVVPAGALQSYREARIPSLQDAIDFTLGHGLVIDVDFKRPPEGHPHRETARDALITVLAASGLGKKAWVPTSSPAAENLTRVTSRTGLDSFLSSDYDLVNAEMRITNENLRALYDHAVPVVVYTVNDVFSFSELWVHGATYVKSDRPWELTGLSYPVMYVPTASFVSAWVLVYGIALVLVSCHARWKQGRVARPFTASA